MTIKKKRVYDDDDGRTVADMNIPGMKGYMSNAARKELNNPDRVKLTRQEKTAMFKAAIRPMLFGLFLICVFFGLTYLLARLLIFLGR